MRARPRPVGRQLTAPAGGVRARPRPVGRQLTAPALAAPVIAAAVIALAGCSVGDDAATTSTTSAATGTATTAASADTLASPGAPATLPPTSTVTSMTSFQSPSGNISCFLAPVQGATPFVRCDLATVTWARPAPEDGCAGDWGGADGRGIVGLGGGEAEVLCAGDTVVDPAAPVLGYGSSITMDPLTCTSTEAGMDCENVQTRHGFVVRAADFVPR